MLSLPERVLSPFRIANAYGLFAVMTVARYEIEFQGSNDGGRTWIAYPFRYKPQDPMERPGIYAPYQPRFEWNLWFASLEPWSASPWVISAQARLVQGSADVLTALSTRSIRRTPAGDGENGEVAVLVHRRSNQASHRRVVAAGIVGSLRGSGFQRCGRASGVHSRAGRPLARITVHVKSLHVHE